MSTPTIASGTVTESIRPSAIGPSRRRKPTHHQPSATRSRHRPHPVTNPSATALSSMTIESHVLAYWSGPKASAASIGTMATIGYTHAVSMPTQVPSSACSIQNR